jgi:hypothetical protein
MPRNNMNLCKQSYSIDVYIFFIYLIENLCFSYLFKNEEYIRNIFYKRIYLRKKAKTTVNRTEQCPEPENAY